MAGAACRGTPPDSRHVRCAGIAHQLAASAAGFALVWPMRQAHCANAMEGICGASTHELSTVDYRMDRKAFAVRVQARRSRRPQPARGRGEQRLSGAVVRQLALALLLVACLPCRAQAWGCEAHETIALLSDRHLTARARKMVYELLEASPVDPRTPRSCRRTTPTPLTDASTWADDVRRDRRSPFHRTGAWHYIDIPRGVSSGDLRRFCPARQGCVLRAIEEQLAVLRASRRTRQRADALRFIVHLIGDLHQPLHTTTNDDRGGNCVPVAYFGIEPRRPPNAAPDDTYRPNLHAIWDTDIIRRILRRRDPARFAQAIERRFQSQVAVWQRQPIDFEEWAWESHRVAEETVYGLLPVPIPVEARVGEASCLRMSSQMLALHQHVTATYQRAAVPVIEERLAKAAIRLAMVLNQIWP